MAARKSSTEPEPAGNSPTGRRGTPKSLKARAVALLARREYSRAELRAKLLGAERSPDIGDEVERLLDELVQLGYLSDARFAQAIVEQKGGTHSRRAIGAALKASGVSNDVAADALTDRALDDDTAMVALWKKRFRGPPADDREKARQVRFLQTRGFSLSAILKLLRNPPSEPDDA